MKRRAVSFTFLLSALAATAAFAQSRAGGEFRVNTFTTGSQSAPSSAARRDGSWMVAWESEGEDGSGMTAMARHYDRFGRPHGDDIQCNTYTTGTQGGPSISTSARAFSTCGPGT